MSDDRNNREADRASAPSVLAASEVVQWRRAERERLIALRLSWSADRRKAASGLIAARASRAIQPFDGRIVSVYWPLRGEPDLRGWMEDLIQMGRRVALPVVVAKGRPLEFRLWSPGDALEKGVWNIPIPAHGAAVLPDIVVAPLVGFDPAKYRLGYGGGFFDRTLAALPDRSLVLGVGYEACRIPTIHPQSHDIPMDVIVTDADPETESETGRRGS